MILRFLADVEKTAEKLKDQEKEIQDIINILKSTKKRGRKVFIIGNGGSAGTATHLACDLFKMAGIKAYSFDNIPLNSAIINDEGWSELFVYQLERAGLMESDVLISISVHGGIGEDKAGAWSQNINKAVKYANDAGAITIGLTGFTGGYLKEKCALCIVVPAESTPLVEAFHVVLHHLIAFSLQEGDRK